MSYIFVVDILDSSY